MGHSTLRRTGRRDHSLCMRCCPRLMYICRQDRSRTSPSVKRRRMSREGNRRVLLSQSSKPSQQGNGSTLPCSQAQLNLNTSLPGTAAPRLRPRHNSYQPCTACI